MNPQINMVVADIGGTHSRFALVQASADQHYNILFQQSYQSTKYSEFTNVLEQFMLHANITAADQLCLALPGVIRHNKTNLTNLDWQLDAEKLQQNLPFTKVTFINDFEAAALGIATLDRNDVIVLNKGNSEPDAIKVVTGAGTGLGLAWIDTCNGIIRYHATEGGHIDFAPANAQQARWLDSMRQQHGHVSYERALCGTGLMQLYQFTRAEHQLKAEPEIMPDEIQQRADNGEEAAISTMQMFVSIYGAFIGNLALLFRPSGGIYLAGGIAPKIITWLQTDTFMHACQNKGRMCEIVKETAILLINNEQLGLQGAIQRVLTMNITSRGSA